MLDLGGMRDRDEFGRRLAVTIAALIVYRIGAQIPLPGISSHTLSQLSAAAVQRISILALGITPLITILILVELVKVVAPRCRRWEQAEPRNRAKLNRIIVALALLAAVLQSLGIAVGLEGGMGLVEEPGLQFRLTCIATLVAGAGLVIWLADLITRHGVGSGVWLFLVTPWLADLPYRSTALAAWRGTPAIVGLQVLLGCILAVLLLAGIVRLIRAGGDSPEMGATCLWSVLLATTMWPWLLIAVALLANGGSWGEAGPWFDPLHPLSLLALAGLVGLFAHLYMRSQRIAGAAGVRAVPPALIVGALAAITLADLLLAVTLPGLPLVGHLILFTVVTLSILMRWWTPPSEEANASPNPRNKQL